MTFAPGLAWRDAVRSLDLVASHRLSLIVRARAGPVRDALLARLPRDRMLRLTADADSTSLGGGIDLLDSLASGTAVVRPGLIERARGKIVVVAGAERLGDTVAGIIAATLDAGTSGVVLLDEGEDAAGVSAMLTDRSAMIVDLDEVSIRDLAIDEAMPAAGETPLNDPVAAFATAAVALGIGSLRAPLQAMAVARALARDGGREEIGDADAECAVRLALAPRATMVPGDADPSPPPAAQPEEPPASDGEDGAGEADRLIDAARVALPDGLLDLRAATRGGRSGSATAARGSAARGRPDRVRAGLPQRGARLDLAATLIAAAPMQRLRGRYLGARLSIAKTDIRVRHPIPRQTALTIFAVDASGSAAMARLAEVKGAVERLLAQSYVRRDEIALIAFRGTGAELLLPPTRSLARAKRELAALPGGGPTPLAEGIVAALAQAVRSRDAGRAPLILLITDGGANVARDGTTGRGAAMADAEAAARLVCTSGIAALVIDSSSRGQDQVASLAASMNARYVALPRLDDAALAAIVGGAR